MERAREHALELVFSDHEGPTDLSFFLTIPTSGGYRDGRLGRTEGSLTQVHQRPVPKVIPNGAGTVDQAPLANAS